MDYGYFSERVFKYLSPGWLKTAPIAEGSPLEIELRSFGLPVNGTNILNICARLDNRPQYLETLPNLRTLSGQYVAALNQVLIAARTNQSLNKLVRDRAFRDIFSRILGVTSAGLETALFYYPDSLLIMGFISGENYLFLNNAYHRFFFHELQELAVEGLTVRREESRLIITRGGPSSLLQAIVTLFTTGCQPLTFTDIGFSTFAIQTVSRTRNVAGYYQAVPGGVTSLFSEEVFYLAPVRYNDMDSMPRTGEVYYEGERRTYQRGATNSLLYGEDFLHQRKNNTSPYTVYTARTPTRSEARVNNLTEFFTQSQRGVLLTPDNLELVLPAVHEELALFQETDAQINSATLSLINRQLATYPTHLSYDDWRTKLVLLSNFTRYQDRVITRNYNPAFMGFANPIIGHLLLQPFLFGSFTDALFLVTHTYIPKNMIFEGTVPKFTPIQRGLTRCYIPEGGDYYTMSLTDRKNDIYLKLYLKYLNHNLSKEELYRDTGMVYNPRVYLEISSISTLIKNQMNADENLARLVAAEPRENIEPLIKKLPMAVMVERTGVLANAPSYTAFERGQSTIFITLCDARTCLNPETGVDLEDTVAKPRIERELSYRFFVEPSEEDAEPYPLIGFGTKTAYVCTTVSELAYGLENALTSTDVEESLKWKLASSRRVRDAAGREYPNPYAEDLLIKPKDYDALRIYFRWMGRVDLDTQVHTLKERLRTLEHRGDVSEFRRLYDALPAAQKTLAQKYIVLTLLMAIYGRRWRGPGFEYPYTANTTQIGCQPEVPVASTAGEMLALFNSAPANLKAVLDSIKTMSYNYDPAMPEFVTRDQSVRAMIYYILGIDENGRRTEPHCIRMYTQGYVMGTGIRYMQELGLTLPGFDIGRLERMSTLAETDVGRRLVGEEAGRKTPVPDYTPIFNYGITLYILPPNEALQGVHNMTEVNNVLTRLSRPVITGIGTMHTGRIPVAGMEYNVARRVFSQVVPINTDLGEGRLLRQDDYILDRDGQVYLPNRDLAPAGLIITPGYVVAQDHRIAPY